MKKKNLTESFKNKIRDIEDLNSKRDLIQNEIIQISLSNTISKKYIWSLHPRLGKSYTLLKLIKLYNNKYGTLKNHLISTPSVHIKKEFIKLFKENNISNVRVSTCSGIFSKKFIKDKSYGIICLDEGDFGVSSPSSIQWSKLLNFKSDHLIAMSGTFNYENICYLAQNGFDLQVEVSIEDGSQMKTIPNFTIYNIGLDLNDSEKEEYGKLYLECEKYLKPFRQVFYEGNWAIFAITNINTSSFVKINNQVKKGTQWLDELSDTCCINKNILLSYIRNYRLCNLRMNEILESYKSKFYFVDELLSLTEDKGVIFNNSIDFCDLLENHNSKIMSYHSKSKNNLEDFTKGSKQVVACINKLTRGFTETTIKWVVILSGNSKNSNFIQRISRGLSIDEKSSKNKNVILVNVFTNDFKFNNQVIMTKDFIKLNKSQEGSTVYWISDLNEIF